MKPRIVIAGGYGLVGGFIARHVRTLSQDVEIILAGRNPHRGDALAEELGNARTVHLRLENVRALSDLGPFDLIVAALNDPADALIDFALAHGAAHIGITKAADDIAPMAFAALRTPSKRPIVLLGHWMAGAMVIAAQKAAEPFIRIDSVEATALYDVRDPIGPMTTADHEVFVGRALLRDGGKWAWVDARQHRRRIRISDDRALDGVPLAVLDVASLASITGAPRVRFDLVEGDSIGTTEGGPASHDLYIDIEGILKSGKGAVRRTILSDPQGQAHLTSLGVLVAIERIFGWDGRPPAEGGLHLPETLVPADDALARFEQFGVRLDFGA